VGAASHLDEVRVIVGQAEQLALDVAIRQPLIGRQPTTGPPPRRGTYSNIRRLSARSDNDPSWSSENAPQPVHAKGRAVTHLQRRFRGSRLAVSSRPPPPAGRGPMRRGIANAPILKPVPGPSRPDPTPACSWDLRPRWWESAVSSERGSCNLHSRASGRFGPGGHGRSQA
jgi:hypothetical protein